MDVGQSLPEPKGSKGSATATGLIIRLVLLALFFMGGELIHGFATALIVGVVIGTYSSIYVASTTVLALGVSSADLMPVAKEGADLDSRP